MALWCRKLYHARYRLYIIEFTGSICVYIDISCFTIYVYIIYIHILPAAQQNSNPPFFPKDKEREVHMESIFKEAWKNDGV